MLRSLELAVDISCRCAQAALPLEELEAARAHRGTGVHREPDSNLRDLREELMVLPEAAAGSAILMR
jgi:hypothetical protein